jgi:hypothetical protein
MTRALARRRSSSLGALNITQGQALAYLGGAVAAYLAYRFLVSRRTELPPEVGASLEVEGAPALNIFSADLSASEAQAFKAALPALGQQYAELFVAAGKRHSLSPFVLAAVCERETGYGSPGACRGQGAACVGSPRAANPDYGLMQINRTNLAAYGIAKTWADPRANIEAGAAILRWTIGYFAQAGGKSVDVSARNAVKLVTTPGSKPDPRPFTDPRELLWYGAAGYNAGPGNVIQALASGKDPDAVTTGNDYGRDVLKRAERLVATTAGILSGGQGSV